jgi:hypothetical protein
MDSGAWLHETFPDMPEALKDLKCGAKTRAGTPCKLSTLYAGGRCKFHGGLSTGPTTDAGKAQARENGKLGGRGRVRKPDPMEAAVKRPCIQPSPTESGNPPLEPKSMETPRYSQGSSLRAEGLAVPNSMDGHITAMVLPTKNPANSDTSIAGNGKVTVWVQCRDCTNLSAGYKCLIPATGQTFPNMGQPRGCVYFVEFK